MSELPDLTVYVDALQRFVVGEVLRRLHIVSPLLGRGEEALDSRRRHLRGEQA